MPSEHEVEVRPIGFLTDRLATIDLAAEIKNTEGHVLRLSRTKIVPGGSLASHTHHHRPEIIYLLEGTLTETRDGRAVEYGSGAVLVMTNGTTHTLENRSTADVVYLSVTARRP